jgi:hypothetical protein
MYGYVYTESVVALPLSLTSSLDGVDTDERCGGRLRAVPRPRRVDRHERRQWSTASSRRLQLCFFFFLRRYIRHRLWLLLSIGFLGEAFQQDALVLTIYMTIASFLDLIGFSLASNSRSTTETQQAD